jgi:RNA polymerase sigma-70 factor, ECF subfamily
MLSTPAQPPDGELETGLLERCKAGEPAAVRAFIDHHKDAVYAALWRITGQPPEAEDLAQETFLRAIRALPGFDIGGTARLSTWLLTIATRLALDACRKQKRQRGLLSAPEPASVPTPEQEVQRTELRGEITSAIDELPPDQRAAFVLAEFHGFGIEDIAAALQTPASTVKTRLFRARAKLSRALAQHRGHSR